MITIMRECATKAKSLEDKNMSFVEVFEEISKSAKNAADETINQMELLKQANVIDSGAYGFSVMLEAAYNCLGIDNKGNVNLKLDGTYSFIPNIPEERSFNKEFFQDSSHDDWGYCVVFAISGKDIDIEKIKGQLSSKGRSLVVSGSDSVCKVHIHSQNPDEILEFSKKFGEISNENISNMDEQFDEMKSNVSQKFKNRLLTFFILPPSREELFKRLTNRDMKDKLIAEERMKQFDKDVLHWKDYNYVIINNDLEDCYKQISEYIDCEINKKQVAYDKDLIKSHIKKLIS